MMAFFGVCFQQQILFDPGGENTGIDIGVEQTYCQQTAIDEDIDCVGAAFCAP